MSDTKRNVLFQDRAWTAPDGVAIYSRDYAGSAGLARLPVVCIHGLTRNSKDFEVIAEVIAATGRRVIVPDVRGRGRSGYDPDAMQYVPPVYARDIIGLLKALGVARAVFVGTSMGGIITMLVAARRSGMVAAAVLNDIGPEAAPEGLARIAGYAGKTVEIKDWEAAAAYVRDINEAAFPTATTELWEQFARRTFRQEEMGLRLDYDPRIREPIAAGKLKTSPRIAWFLFRMLARRRPTLVLRGQLSDILNAGIAARMKKAAPRMQLVEVPGVGHAPLLSEPDAVGAIVSFLSRVP